MLKAIRSFFREAMSPPAEPGADAEAGAGEKDVRLAACALLLELAHADDEFSEEERRYLEHAVRRQYGLDEAEAEELVRLAEQERAQAVDLWQFTRLIAESYSPSQKVVLLEVMWGLVFADGRLAAHEDHLMRKISHLLGVEAGYLTAARKRAQRPMEPPASGKPD